MLAEIEGIWVEPASAAGVAGLRRAALQNPHAYSNKTIVCVLTGHGLKDPTTVIDRAPEPLQIPAELSALQEAIVG
jgi:threonine synthase